MWAWVRHNIVMLTSPVLFTRQELAPYIQPPGSADPPTLGGSAALIFSVSNGSTALTISTERSRSAKIPLLNFYRGWFSSGKGRSYSMARLEIMAL